MGEFFKKAFREMAENAKTQHEVDKANFEAVKAESKAQWEQAKSMANPETRKKIMQEEREAQIAAAKERTDAANERYNKLKNKSDKRG